MRSQAFARQRWSAIAGGLGYAFALLVVAEFAFTLGVGSNLWLPSGMARTGSYQADHRLPAVVAVDAGRVATAILDAEGRAVALPVLGDVTPATAGGALDAGGFGQPQPSSAPAPIAPATTPTYTGATTTQQLSLASLLAQIPLNLRFPPSSQAAHRHTPSTP
jgi:hypothetical protein